MDCVSTVPPVPVVDQRKPCALNEMSLSEVDPPTMREVCVTPIVPRASPIGLLRGSAFHPEATQSTLFSPSSVLASVIDVGPVYCVRHAVHAGACHEAKPCCTASSAAAAPRLDGALDAFTL